MQNPFTTTFSKTPEYTYIPTTQPDEILENFSYDRPSESVYKITGVRGSGKTVILGIVEQKLKDSGWIVLDVSPTRDTLQQIAAMLTDAGFSKKKEKNTGFNISATVMRTGGGFGYTTESDNKFFDIGVEVENMIQKAAGQRKKILIGIDEISRTDEMVKFASEYGRWLRAGYPVYLVCTGLYENIQELSNVKNLTFFRRATTIQTEPLNKVLMTEMYKNKLNVSSEDAKKMAYITKGYAYAFQEFGVLSFKDIRRNGELNVEDTVSELKSGLFAYSYEKIWEEMTEMDRFLAKIIIDKEEYKREEVISLMGEKAGNYSMYRDRLLKRGIITARQGYISLALPFFADYVKEYCIGLD